MFLTHPRSYMLALIFKPWGQYGAVLNAKSFCLSLGFNWFGQIRIKTKRNQTNLKSKKPECWYKQLDEAVEVGFEHHQTSSLSFRAPWPRGFDLGNPSPEKDKKQLELRDHLCRDLLLEVLVHLQQALDLAQGAAVPGFSEVFHIWELEFGLECGDL